MQQNGEHSGSENVEGSESEEDLNRSFHIENLRTHSEYMTMKAVTNFNQGSLKSNAIYMLDFDSEVYIWVGSRVHFKKYVKCFAFVGKCARAVNCKGSKRRDKISFGITFQGFEPDIFKSAFKTWSDFPRPGVTEEEVDDAIEEESSGEESDGNTESSQATKATTSGVPETASGQMSREEKKQLASMQPESFWIKF